MLSKIFTRRFNFKPIQRKSFSTKSEFFELPSETHKRLYDKYSRHVTFLPMKKGKFYPLVSDDCFVAPSATLAGRVEMFKSSSVWYGCVIRGDSNFVRIGQGTNIQDNSVILENIEPLDLNHDGSTIIGHFVTIGHNCLLKACTVEDNCLIGMGSILEEGSYMEKNSMLGAFSVLTAGTRVPSGQLWMGNPAKFHRELNQEEIEQIENSANRYIKVAKQHFYEYSVEDLTPVKQAVKEGLIKAEAEIIYEESKY